MKCTIIGYWSGSCKKNEACSGYLLTHQGFHLLLDCGSGVVSVLQNVAELNDIHHILLSHYHYDHYSDMGAAIYARLVNTQIGATDKVLHFYGQELEPEFSRLTMAPYTVGHPISAQSSLDIGPFHCTFLKTSHPVDCLAVKVECAGKTLVYTADTAYFPELVGFSQGADLLIAECSLYPQYDGSQMGHMNCIDVARLAAETNPGHLILTHLPLYGEPQTLLEEVRSRWSGRAELAGRLKVVELD